MLESRRLGKSRYTVDTSVGSFVIKGLKRVYEPGKGNTRGKHVRRWQVEKTPKGFEKLAKHTEDQKQLLLAWIELQIAGAPTVTAAEKRPVITGDALERIEARLERIEAQLDELTKNRTLQRELLKKLFD